MRYIVVVAVDGEIDSNPTSFDTLKKAKAAADEEAAGFDLDHNPGDVVVFEINEDAVTEVYRPEISSYDDDDVEEDDIE